VPVDATTVPEAERQSDRTVIVFFDPDSGLHDPTEPHRFGGVLLAPAETASRAQRILGALEADGGYQTRRPEHVDRSLLLEVHTSDYLDFLETAYRRWQEQTGGGEGAEAVAYIRPLPATPWREPSSVLAQLGRYSNDVDPILAGTWEAALAAASCAAGAAAASVENGVAYALSRPPGHHAAPDTYGGYCYLNNTAIAASWLRRVGDRVAVVDVDTHHGNGTQTVFWDRPDVLTISIHGDPDHHFPFFLGYSDEIGAGPGEGFNRNYPLPTGTDWPNYEDALRSALGVVARFGADFLVVALGVDTHAAHGVMSLRRDDYTRMGGLLAKARLPTVFVQEGGYEPGTLEEAVPAVLKGFVNEM
jgi:acetoin utilization deacetylase AcuC-like enzyme